MITARRNGAVGVGRGDTNRTKIGLGLTLEGGSPEARLEEFIDAARKTKRPTFGSAVFEDRKWPVIEPGHEDAKRKSGQNHPQIWFTQRGSGSKNAGSNPDLLPPFNNFARALIRLRNEVVVAGHSKHTKTIDVLRYLHDAAADRTRSEAHPAKFERKTFEQAMDLMRKRGVSANTLYVYGKELETISSYIDRYELSKRKIDFKSNAATPKVGATRKTSPSVGDGRTMRADSRAEPISDRAWQALGSIAQMITTDADKFRMAAVILLAIGGWRINELLALSADMAFLDGPLSRGGKPIALEADVSSTQIFVRYRLSKENRWHEKKMPTAAAELVWEAYCEIHRISAPAREAARFMHDNPGRVLLPPAWRGLDPDTLIPATSLRPNLRVENLSGWVKRHGLTIHDGDVIRLGDIEAALLKQQATGIPGCTLALHELLFIMPGHLCWKDRQPKPHIVEILDESQMRVFLSGADEKSGIHSIFKRFPLKNEDGSDLVEEDGSPIRITAHQFRHFVSQTAIKNGSGYFALAAYFGRNNIEAGHSYTRLPRSEMTKRTQEVFNTDSAVGPILEALRLMPDHEQKVLRASIANVTVETDLGICVLDWSTLPCPHLGQCGGCPESFILKGDPTHRDRATHQLLKHTALVRAAERHLPGTGTKVSNHLGYHRRMVDALKQIVAIHENDKIPEGTYVQVISASQVVGAGMQSR